MTKKWINLFFKFSGLLFNAKKKVVSADNWIKALPYVLLVVVLELIFTVVSLPMYLIVSPSRIQERGFIFPLAEKERKTEVVRVYATRRKISLATGAGTGIFIVFKVLLLVATSLYLLGGQTLLAATQDWTFDNAGDYSYDSGKIEVTGGVARLKNTGTTTSGSTTNSTFTTNATGWTYTDWINGKKAAGAYVASGGNTDGYINITLSDKENKTTAGFWSQGFTTTVSSPTTATLNLDWKSISTSLPATPITYKLYAFIDTGTEVPVLGTEVWSSGEITSTTDWASVTTIDIASKVQSAGTYYLKIAAYLQSPASPKGIYGIVAGFDNVIVNWSKSTISYATDKPTISPTTSLSPAGVLNWDSFTESSTKNGGEIYYQLSDDDGSTWKYWNGSAWATAGVSNYNIATVVNDNISSFPATNKKIKWKAFLESDGSQQVVLSNIQIGYTENDFPDVENIIPTQSENTGLVNITYDLLDDDSDPASLVTYEYSLTGDFAGEQSVMTAFTTDLSHDGLVGLSTSPTGVNHGFVWDAQADLGDIATTTYIRLRANDGIGNGNYTTSTGFFVDYVDPIVSAVTAYQVASSTDVNISYNLADDTTSDLFVEIDISEDGGSTWTVVDTSVSGDVGAGITVGAGKSIIWSAGVDFDEQSQVDMRVRVRARDKYQNQGVNTESADFSLDTVDPVINIIADLQAQPNAGDTTVLIGGSFTENNPNTNTFYVAINGGAYSSGTAGDSNTATPSNQFTNTDTTLDGNDYISGVKIIHIDDFGQIGENENSSPNSNYKYVKPYTPQAPILSNPITNQLDLAISKHTSEASGLEYLIQETTTGNYVQANGTLGVSEVWQTDSAWGTVTVTGLTSPVANYIFKVKSRNPSDPSDQITSQSEWSATAQITNSAPSISFGSIGQTTDGSRYTTINYTGTDGQGDINNLDIYEYSTDNSNWFTMTEKSGVGSDGISNLVFLAGGSAHDFMWDSGTDVSGVEDASVYVRLRSSDTIASSTLVTSSAFEVDNITPVVTNVSASQDASAKTVTISYDLTDANNSTVEIDISDDGGLSWNITDTSVAGDIGAGVTPGVGKSITWNAGADFDGQYQTDIRVRVRARDSFGNQGDYTESADFVLDTNNPVVSNISASQDSGLKTFTFNYDVSEDLGNITIGLEVSNDGGATWVVPVTSATGDIGAGITPGAGKSITWNGATDYNGNEENDMQIRITATDQFTNVGNNYSAYFSLDTLAPRITSVSATQSGNVIITYNLADDNWSTIEIDISSDGGSTWTVTDTSVTGDVGSSVVEGVGKSITWDASADFDNQEQSDMRVRVRGLDTYSNQSGYTQSANFSLDTVDPVINITADLQAQPNAGDTTVLIGGSFTENNPNTNTFYVAINGGAYSSGTAGDTNTASPSNQATAVDTTLDGNDYISGVKIIHTDDFGQIGENENTNPSVGYKYVKPYTPSAPTVYNPTVGTVDVLINLNASETSGLEYAIYETTQGKWVQSNGTLGASEVWQVRGTGVGQWGNDTGTIGAVTVNGLVNDSYTYIFQVKSRNISDTSHSSSSESSLSAGASSVNQSPTITIDSVAQTADGTKYVIINYTGTDLENESSNIITAEYSTDNSNWFTMTEKSGVGSDGTNGLDFSSGAGTAHDFMWDVGTDLSNVEDNSVYVRLQANDGTSNGNIEISSAFTVDTKNPIVASPTASQIIGTNSVTFGYVLTDLSNSTIEIDISEDGGSTWAVTDTSVTGDIGAGVSPGSGKVITWDAGSDFNNQDQSDMRVRIRALDLYGNQSVYVESADFDLDTANPIIANVTASQNSGASTVTITYDIADTNNSTVEVYFSDDGGNTWTVNNTSVTGDVGSGITSGLSKSIIWNAGSDFPGEDQLDMKVRVRAYDIYANSSNVAESINFSLDTLGPVISNVVVYQDIGTDNVIINYDLVDNSVVDIGGDISDDGGLTWSSSTGSVTGDFGSGITAGTGKTIIWDAGTDFPNQDQNDMRVRINGTDSFNNSSGNIESSNFSLDTKSPSLSVTANLYEQPDAGENSVAISGSFIETNPNSNLFYVAINGGTYSSATSGISDTADPGNQDTLVGATLDGNDYVSGVKIAHVDDFGHTTENENTSPSVLYRYVKPYTPLAPTVDNPQNTSVDVVINKNISETDGLEYAIYESSTGLYVQSSGTLGASAVWQEIGTLAGQWGFTAGIAGKITVSGLSSPVAQYGFQVKSRNVSDPLDAISSQSNLSASAGISNSAPNIAISSAVQQTGGVNYVLIDYIGTDNQNDTIDLIQYEYSTDNSNWFIMTEKSGVGSNGTSSLAFTSGGASLTFAWDVGADLAGVEDSTVYVRLKASDTLIDGNLAVSSAFAIDNSGPVISNISISQSVGTNNIIVEYDLADSTGSGNNVEIDISNDGGSTWTVTDTSVSGDIGVGVSAGTSRSIIWDAGVDFDNEEQSDMVIRLRATDAYGNTGAYNNSDSFTIDTSAPIVSGVSASQDLGMGTVSIAYNLADISAGGNNVEIGVSSDGGSTWDIATTTASGDIGLGQSTGSKVIIWDAATDFPGGDELDMRVRVRATDYYGNIGNYVSSVDFSVDTADPVISNLTASQVVGSNDVTFNYDLSDTNSTNLTVEMDISSDGGLTWTVTDSSSVGDIGSGVDVGIAKIISWSAGIDFDNQEESNMRVRIRATDTYGNVSSYFSSANFALDTAGPLGLLSFTEFTATDTTVTLNWSTGITDANFDHFEIWYGFDSGDVDSRTGTAVEWSDSDDINLANINTISTVITGLSDDIYYAKIWAVDMFGNESTIGSITFPELTPEPEPEPVVGGGGGGINIQDTIPPSQPIITPLSSPTNLNTVSVSGLAEPRSLIDLYDNNVLVARFSAVVDNNGLFSQDFFFDQGIHALTARASDFAGNVSGFSNQITLIVDQSSPTAPIILSPSNFDTVTTPTPEIIGVAEPFATVTILIDGVNYFEVEADSNGSWRFIVPSASALDAGSHTFLIGIIDEAGNIGDNISINLTRSEILLTPPEEVIPPPVVPSIPLPPEAEITEIVEAIELPGVPTPEITRTAVEVADNIIRFEGESLPNKDIVVYIHSDQAVIYRTRSDENGLWSINHSQDIIELSSGEHSIFAVTVDTAAKIKSRPSEVKLFDIKKSLLVTLYNILNIQTTIAVIFFVSLMALWLYNVKRKSLSPVSI